MTVQLHELSASDQQRNDLTVSVIICAYTMKRWDDLVDAVHSACSQLRQYDECLLVIDHNAELLERASLEFAGIQIMPNRSTAGLSGARNTGASIAQGDIVVFIDDDAVADSMMIENMRQAFDHPDVWGVGGSPLPAWPTGKRPGWFPAEFDWVVGCAYTGLPTERAEVRNMIGAAMAFRRQVFDSVGMFSVGIGRVGTIPVGAEETELCIRLRQARPDIRIVHVPQATVAHRVSADRVRWSYFLRRCYGEGISKGLVSRLVGSQQGLSSERAYVSSVLPKAFFRAIGAGLGGKVSRFGAAIAIVLGVAMAAVGYVRGRLSLAAKALQVSYESDSTTGRFQPVLVADIESSVGSMWLPPRRFDGERYGGAEVLIRSGADPLAIVRIPAEDLGKDIDLSPYLNDSPGTPLFFQHSDTLLKLPSISVIIPTYGRPETIGECVRSVLDTQWPKLEVIIADNNPGDTDSATKLREIASNDDRVQYVAAWRKGASHARNEGLAAATGEIVAFTDDDVIVDSYWLHALADAFVSGDIACVTGLVLPKRLDTPAQLWFERYGGFGKGLSTRMFTESRPSGAGVLYPFAAGMFGSGNNVAFRRDILVKLGGYDIHLGPGTATCAGEDLDLFVRLVRAGEVLCYEPRALVRHDHRAEPAALLRQLHSYGRGISAMLCAQIAHDIRTVPAILRRVPAGLMFLFVPSSSKNQQRGHNYPTRLVVAEITGIIIGPLSYLGSRLGGIFTRGRSRSV